MNVSGEYRSAAEVFAHSYGALVRLAALIIGSTADAEEIVQDAFLGLHRNWAKAADPLAYVRRSVVYGSRSAIRRKSVARRHAPTLQAGYIEGQRDVHDEVWDVIAKLPERQRSALVLRYWGDMPERDIADAMGCRPATVRSLVHRALASLRQEVER